MGGMAAGASGPGWTRCCDGAYGELGCAGQRVFFSGVAYGFFCEPTAQPGRELEIIECGADAGSRVSYCGDDVLCARDTGSAAVGCRGYYVCRHALGLPRGKCALPAE